MRRHGGSKFYAGVLVLAAAATWLGLWGLRPGANRAYALGGTGTVYTMTNATSDNAVMAYTRASNGTLTLLGTYSTQGLGSGNDLYSQGAVTLTPGNQFLLVVNPGSNDVSSFAVQPNGSLVFVDRVSSAGFRPVSVAAFGNLVYVVNFGPTPTPNVVGYTLGAGGTLTEIVGSSRNLSATSARPGEVTFSDDGSILVAQEKNTSKLDTFTVGSNGIATGPMVQNSNGMTPFGMAFDNLDHLIVAEAAASTVSSYSVATNGVLTVISGSVPDDGSKACWVATSNNPGFPTQYSYIANTGSHSISSLSIGASGALTLVASRAGSNVGDVRDMAVSTGSTYLYGVSHTAGFITGLKLNSNGTMTQVVQITGIPNTAQGMAAY